MAGVVAVLPQAKPYWLPPARLTASTARQTIAIVHLCITKAYRAAASPARVLTPRKTLAPGAGQGVD